MTSTKSDRILYIAKDHGMNSRRGIGRVYGNGVDCRPEISQVVLKKTGLGMVGANPEEDWGGYSLMCNDFENAAPAGLREYDDLGMR